MVLSDKLLQIDGKLTEMVVNAKYPTLLFDSFVFKSNNRKFIVPIYGKVLFSEMCIYSTKSRQSRCHITHFS
jgi:hypothetical protein